MPLKKKSEFQLKYHYVHLADESVHSFIVSLAHPVSNVLLLGPEVIRNR